MKNGFLAIDKPENASSHQVVRTIKRLFNTHQVGHTGTLDPLATGLLLIAIGEATKFIPHISNTNKSYEAEALLGVTTNSYDSESSPTHHFPVADHIGNQLKNIIDHYPDHPKLPIPPYSACKYQGHPLYFYARKGIYIHLPHKIYKDVSLQLIDYQSDRYKIRIQCPSGTYIRSIIHDIGIQLKCGSIMTKLRRLKNGSITQMHSLEDNLIDKIIPIQSVLQLPTIEINDRQLAHLIDGKVLQLNTAHPPSTKLSLIHRNIFVGVGIQDSADTILAKRLLKKEILTKRIENP